MSQLFPSLTNDLLGHELVKRLEPPWRYLLWCALVNQAPKDRKYDKYIEEIGSEGKQITDYFLANGLITPGTYRNYALIYSWNGFDVSELGLLSEEDCRTASIGGNGLVGVKFNFWYSEKLFKEVVFNLMLNDKDVCYYAMEPSRLVNLAVRAARIDIARIAINESDNPDWFLGPDELHELVSVGYHSDPFITNVTSIPKYFNKLRTRLNDAYEDRLRKALQMFEENNIKPHRLPLYTIHPIARAWLNEQIKK